MANLPEERGYTLWSKDPSKSMRTKGHSYINVAPLAGEYTALTSCSKVIKWSYTSRQNEDTASERIGKIPPAILSTCESRLPIAVKATQVRRRLSCEARK